MGTLQFLRRQLSQKTLFLEGLRWHRDSKAPAGIIAAKRGAEFALKNSQKEALASAQGNLKKK